eukprot:TRINITY_DN112539_c0_g1_i1.p1 TRINITY_DN112539_c0_g1~~TRINITY_DN112539_c0_g1_i1.p1  ORF type:complete len:471 (+),score=70.45 TRINITY_DN112539_c0_g1_i1:160-1413(+)
MDSQELALDYIARVLGKEEALQFLHEAAAHEEAGDFDGAIRAYKRAYRGWPALDSVNGDGGLPLAVMKEAEAASINLQALTAVEMDVEESPRFDVSEAEKWSAYLDEHGYCVIKGVADEGAIEQAKTLLWDFMEGVPGTKVTRDDSSTWERRAGWLPSPSNGILGTAGFAHSEVCWKTRLLPGVQEAFAALWGTRDLLASFDGGSVFRPWAQRPDWKTEGSWWHVDQNPFLTGRKGRTCVQGFVTYTDATPATGGLCVIPGSHKVHEDFCERACGRQLSSDFIMVLAGDPALRAGSKLVCAKAGDLVLWDSRCIHCNTPGEQSEGLKPNSGTDGAPELLRFVSYVCMTPASWASRDVLEKRKQAYIRNLCTDHWPHEFHGSAESPEWLPPNQWRDTAEAQRRLIVGAGDKSLLDNGH